ncbi:hypothetical protein L198_07363 [Cryptococcus wingfieldii CBS 7118]|uniref:DNA replication regulator Sld3 C-terminal domain-containing protein n=1 Tax=Cryptococcus wingfieldii CBS 7118 TaxID=1295528 RepID=A0A1E3IBT8_9TREE|nr:hypothetical protein L198_07363 [Cryptococcus wingfieldii CBS 7118]ODN86070.1 hypothetical protein L198_07363 [Cryptococcus wingfieldii CBS 7118]
MALITPLPYPFDLSCPLPKSTKPINAPHWPFPVAGPSTYSQEPVDLFGLAPLHAFAQDIARIPPHAIADALSPLMISLPSIESRHRNTILPEISTSTSADQTRKDLTVEELAVIRAGMAFRLECRAIADSGEMPAQKTVADQLEKREYVISTFASIELTTIRTLIQLMILLSYTQHTPRPLSPPLVEGKLKKRKRSRTSNVSPTSSPDTATDLLLDRISIWQALSGLDLDLDLDNLTGMSGNASGGGAKSVKGKEKEENGLELMLRAFWDDVLVPFYLKSHPAILQSYHEKTFGTPAPATLFPPKTSSAEVASGGGAKSRKPKLTRALGSADGQVYPSSTSSSLSRAPSALLPPAPVQDTERGRPEKRERQPAAGSRAPSRTGSEVSVGSERSFVRTFSRTESQSQSQGQGQFRRSRSVSIDPSVPLPVASSSTIGGLGKKPLARTASGKGKEMMNIQGRQVGLRRAGSKKLAPSAPPGDASAPAADSQGRESQSQLGQRGLMGRKTSSSSNPFRPKHFLSSTSSSSLSFAAQQEADTLIMATPSKPKHQSQTFAWHPTPIQEEPTSLDRDRDRDGQRSVRKEFVAETPVVGGGRMRGEWAYGSLGEGVLEEEVSGEGLGGLMVMTDEEDMGEGTGEGTGEVGGGRARAMFVPETPVK